MVLLQQTKCFSDLMKQQLSMQVKMKSLKQTLVKKIFQYLLEMVYLNPLRLF